MAAARLPATVLLLCFACVAGGGPHQAPHGSAIRTGLRRPEGRRLQEPEPDVVGLCSGADCDSWIGEQVAPNDADVEAEGDDAFIDSGPLDNSGPALGDSGMLDLSLIHI